MAAWPHHGFVQFHPFSNGNGHVTRALVAWHLVQHDYLPIVVTRDDRNNYIDTLEAADSGDLDPVVIFAAHLHRRDPADHDKASDKRSQKKRVAGERRHQPLQLKERSISRPASHTLNFCHRAADGRMVPVDVGETIIRLEGLQFHTPVIFAEENEPSLLGVVTLEEASLAVDPMGGRLIPTHLRRY